jgi:hypothetical protein
MSGLRPNILTPGKFLFYSVSHQGIAFTDETPKDEWLDAMRRLSAMYDGAIMTQERCLRMMADALNWGEDKFGEDFAQAVDGARQALGLKPRTLANAMWAYKRIDAPRRKDGLRLGHYIVLAALEPAEQDKLIDEALKNRMTVEVLKDHVAEAFPKTKHGKTRKAAKIDDEKTALQKLIDANQYLLSVPSADIGNAWKSHVEAQYKIYRRRWLTKRKDK